MKSSMLFLPILIIGLILSGCGSDDATTTPTTTASGITSVADLPAATQPVSTSYSSAATRLVRDIVSGDIYQANLASTGGVLSSLAITDFSSATNKSRGACEAGSMLKQTYEKASDPDKIQCYIGTIADNASTVGLSASQLTTDGTYNYFEITEGEFVGSVKFKIVKNSAGAITEFEMFECMSEGVSHGANTGYIHTQISGTDLTMTVKNIGSWSSGSDGGSYGESFSVTGVLSGSNYVSKQLTRTYEHSSTGTYTGSGYGKVVVNEYSDSFKLNAFTHMEGTGTWGSDSFANSQDLTAFGVIQLLNANTDGRISTLAMGDGSIKAVFDDKNISGNAGPYTVANAESCTAADTPTAGCWVQSATDTMSWTGDDMEETTFGSSEYGYTEVNETTPSLTQTDPTISFETSEQWDCTTVAESDKEMISINITTIATQMATCDTKYGFGDGGDSHIDCWQLEQ